MDETPILIFEPRDELVMLARLAVAVACGAVLGIERRRRLTHPAGIRTMTLVTAGSAVFMLVSQFGFGEDADPARIAAQVVTGVGFIGAGIMFMNRRRVRNLTTASTIWIAAGIGLAAGSGLFVLAGAATIAATAVLILIRPRLADNEDSRTDEHESDG